MISVNDCLTKAVRVAREKLGARYRLLHEKFGPPAEHSALSSVHFLMEEYQEPPPLAPIAPYRMSVPPVEIVHKTEYLQHPGRRGRLRVDLSFPREYTDEALPTVVISPGLGAHRTATRYVEQHLAGCGFLVVRPTHAGSDWTAVALKTPLGAFTRTELRRRLDELSATLEALERGTWDAPRCGRLCLMGHSFGALTCSLFAGLRAQGIEVRSPSSVDSLIILSPYGNSFPTQRLGIEPESFRELKAPTLFISGTKDDLWTLGRGSRGHLEPYLLCQAPVKTHLLIGGTRHGHFSEIFGWVRRDTKIMVNSTVAAFLDAHMKAETAGVQYLESHLPLVALEHGSWVL